MIIVDLDGTLANCEHRRHFVDRDKAAQKDLCYEDVEFSIGGIQPGPWVLTDDPDRLWKPDWQSFYEACDKDEPIQPVITTMRRHTQFHEIQIWSGRCESVKDKTIDWIYEKIPGFAPKDVLRNHILKMRPIGDYTPDDELKEKWLDEYFHSPDGNCPLRCATHDKCCKKIDFVFDDRPSVIRMWRKRGIFVFNCCQHEEEF